MNEPGLAHIHGRFQPFHREHLQYAEWAAEDADELLIGITNADPSHVRAENADQKRDAPEHNPFTYYERYRMIQETITEQLDPPVNILPFPINRPELWEHYAPTQAVHYVNVLEEWHEVKVARLREAGRTVVTKEGTRTVSGTDIRERMARSVDWHHLVPAPVASWLDRNGGEERVRRAFDPDG